MKRKLLICGALILSTHIYSQEQKKKQLTCIKLIYKL